LQADDTQRARRPRLVLINGLRPETSTDLYEDVADRLRARGLDVLLIHGLDAPVRGLQRDDVLVSNIALPADLAVGLRVYAGRPMSRPASLQLLADAGVPTMTWKLAARRRHVRELFREWDVERLLLKPSFTYGGRGVQVFTRRAVWRLRWTSELDVFCREVNPDDGDVFKAELFNGALMIAWMSKAPPLRTLVRGSFHRGIRGAYGDRMPCELPPQLAQRLCAFSRTLTDRGLSYVSVDLMRRPDGELVAIELNPRDVATWWTRQFPDFRERYANALCDLVATEERRPGSDTRESSP
jgi:hypothetical protein